MSLKIVRLLIIGISRNLKSFFEKKFKFDGVEKYQAQSGFSRKFERRKMLK